MKKRIVKLNIFVAVTLVGILLGSAVLPTALAANIDNIDGFDKGPSYQSVVPLKQATFVNFDKDTYLDDYAYLAAVPTAVFNDGDRLFSYPLLFTEKDVEPEEEKYKTLYAREGLNYFMEDWMSYCGNKLDRLTAINVPKGELDSNWKAKETNFIEADNPYDIACELALSDWSYSDEAVIAVIGEEFETPDNEISNEIEGTLPALDIDRANFNVKQSNSLDPVFHGFTVGEGYKYIKAEAWWDLIFKGKVMIPTGDPDLQLYCKQDGEWMQVVATADWQIHRPRGHEYTFSHIYSPGPWQVGITDFPTEGNAPRKELPFGQYTIQGSLIEALRKGVTYHVDITMYPGVDLKIPEVPPFGARDANFTLTWENKQIDLGFTLMGPGGEALFTVVENEDDEEGIKEINLKQLGECLPGEHYSVSVFCMNDVPAPINFKVEYDWEQGISEEEANALTSATEGAVLASMINAPLLYTSASELPESTKDALYKLGVESICLVNLGGNLSEEVKEEINNIATIEEDYEEPRDIYDAIREITGSNDVIFSTIDPWSYWYLAKSDPDRKPAGETEAGHVIGPAAYIAAHHGAPVLIVDNHPRLSSAATYHTEWWRNYAYDRGGPTPSAAEFYFTGTRVYDFLKDYGFDQVGDETIITVADQYDIGSPWDRTFVGVANPGRFFGNPIDIAYWISRSVFYPALIYVNPALNGEVTLITGSESERQGIRGLFKKPYLNTQVITRTSGTAEYEYPVLCSFVTHKYRFNERASKLYGTKYQCANGWIPGETATMEPIDQGSIEKFTGKDGAYFPDISQSEVIPFYLERGGYEVGYSTALEPVINNANQGVILWFHGAHGNEGNGGQTQFWDPNVGMERQTVGKIAKRFAAAPKDPNPWRGYEWLLGSTDEPDTMSMDIQGAIPYTGITPPFRSATGVDNILAPRPFRVLLNELIPIIDPFEVDTLYDGVVGPILIGLLQADFKTVLEIEEAGLDNLYSAGFFSNMCQTSTTYMHLALIRHGTVFQILDPWPTSWYAAVWTQSIPRDIALGYTVGEAYARGISYVGPLYINDPPQWWWDDAENVEYFGDPDLRVFVPSTEYSDANYWEREETKALRYDRETSINGHTPFGATEYPNEKEPLTILSQYLWVIIALIVIIILLIAIAAMGRKKEE